MSHPRFWTTLCTLAVLWSCDSKDDLPDVTLDTTVGDTTVSDTVTDIPADSPADSPLDTTGADTTVTDTLTDTTATDTVTDTGIEDVVGDGCPIPAPDPVASSPLGGTASPGTMEVVLVDDFTDYYLHDATDTIKVGARVEWGGTIVFFGEVGTHGPGMNASNVIDANDTGREVQVAFYDREREFQNCAHDASCLTSDSECADSIQYLGWNPVQGGNRCNIGSGIETWDFTDGVLSITTIPLFWNPNWDRADCESDACTTPGVMDRPSDVRVTQKLEFVRTHVLALEYEVENLSEMDHIHSAHEMPTIYTANATSSANDLWKLFDSTGTHIPIDTPTSGVEGFMYENFDSAGGWAAMQNDAEDYGVGLYMENRLTSWQAWQLRSLPFNNFRPLPAFPIPGHGTIRTRSYLIIGSLGTIETEANWLDANLPPFGSLDTPAADDVLSGTVTVTGWAMDNKSVSAVELLVDGAVVATLTYGGSRPDVCTVWPQYSACDDVGFSGTFDASGLSACGNVLEIRATDGDGNSRIIGRKRVFGSS